MIYRNLNRLQVRLRLTAWNLQLLDVGGHDWAVRIVMKGFLHWVVHQWIKVAWKRFLGTQGASRNAQMGTIDFNANAAQLVLLFRSQGDLQSRKSRSHIAATLASWTMIKQQLNSPLFLIVLNKKFQKFAPKNFLLTSKKTYQFLCNDVSLYQFETFLIFL